MSEPLRIMGHRVLLRPDIDTLAPEELPSGIVTAKTLAAAVDGTDSELSYTRGTVLQVGNGVRCQKCATNRPIEVQPGDDVILPHTAGHQITIDGDIFVIVNATDILAVLEPA